MSNFIKYFYDVKAQKQIDKLCKKYANKKIVIYGAGEYFRILNTNLDISKLNIVGIADKKFETNKNENSTNYPTLTPAELKEYDFDIILVALYDDAWMCDYLEYELLINTKNEGKKVLSIIEPTFLYALKVLLGK